MGGPPRAAGRDSAVSIAVVYPDLLGTYGDGGNARILAERLRWRGLAAETVTVPLGTPLPETCHIYVLGGGEDGPQSLAADELGREGALARAVDAGAAVLAVCAGLQVLGTEFRGADGVRPGVGLVDARTVGALGVRAVGELVVEPDPALGLPRLSGYENHAGVTELGAGVTPFATVVSGVGNGAGGGDGFVAGRVVGTYLHGPALARNPELADLVLGWVVGHLAPLDPALDAEALGLRRERLQAVADGSSSSAADAGGGRGRGVLARMAGRVRSRR